MFDAFDPDQPRDKDGKFSETGAGGGAAESKTTSKRTPDFEARVNGPEAKDLVERAVKNGGMTYSVMAKVFPERGFVVSAHQEHELVIRGSELTAEQMSNYIASKREIFDKDPKAQLGAWYDGKADKWYLDVSHLADSAEEARAVATANNQEAFYDLEKGETVYVKEESKRRIDEEAERREAHDRSAQDDAGRDRRGDASGASRVHRKQEVDEFDPNQPRDKGGQWSKEGGGSGGASKNPKVEKAKAKHAALVKAYEEAKQKANNTPSEALQKAAFKAGKAAAAAKHAVKKLEDPSSIKSKTKIEKPKVESPTPVEPPKPPPNPKVEKAKAKHEEAVKAYAAAKAALAEAHKTGDAEKIAAAKLAHFKAGKRAAAAKHATKKLSGEASDITITKAVVKPQQVLKSGQHAQGATMKVAGKTESGGPLVGTVIASSPNGTHTLLLPLGKTQAEWHANETLSAHATNSTWAKEKEKLGKAVAEKHNAEWGTFPEGGVDFSKSVKGEEKATKAKEEAEKEAKSKLPAVGAHGLPVTNHADFVAVKSHFVAWSKELTHTETSAVVSYTGSGYSQINSYLRKGGDPSTDNKIKAIDAALAKSSGLPKAVILRRGMNGDFEIAAGDTYSDKGFMSTSLGDGFASAKNQLVINAPKGAKGAFLVQSSYSGEKEFLLPRNSQIKVTKVETINGKRIIHGDLVADAVLDAAENDAPTPFDETLEPDVDLSNNPKFVGEPEDLVITKGKP